MPPDGADSKKDALAEAMATVTSQTKKDSSTATTTTTGAKDSEVEAVIDGASSLAGRLTNHKSPPCANDSREKCLGLADLGVVGSCCCWEFPLSEVKKNTLVWSKKIKSGGGDCFDRGCGTQQ